MENNHNQNQQKYFFLGLSKIDREHQEFYTIPISQQYPEILEYG